MDSMFKAIGLFASTKGSPPWSTFGANATYLVAGTTGIGFLMSRVSKAFRRHQPPSQELQDLFADISSHAKLAGTFSTPEEAAAWFEGAFPNISTLLLNHVLKHIQRLKKWPDDHRAMVEAVLDPIKNQIIPILAALWKAASGEVETNQNLVRISNQAHAAIQTLKMKVHVIKNALMGKYDGDKRRKNMRGGLDKGLARAEANRIRTLEKKLYNTANSMIKDVTVKHIRGIHNSARYGATVKDKPKTVSI